MATIVRYGRTINCGNYENMQILVEEEVRDGETTNSALLRAYKLCLEGAIQSVELKNQVPVQSDTVTKLKQELNLLNTQKL